MDISLFIKALQSMESNSMKIDQCSLIEQTVELQTAIQHSNAMCIVA